MPKCVRCNEQVASKDAPGLARFLPMLIGLPPLSADAYCKDCDGGISFLALLATVVVTMVLLVSAIAFW